MQRSEGFFTSGQVFAEGCGKNGEAGLIDGCMQAGTIQSARGDGDGLVGLSARGERFGPRDPGRAEIRVERDGVFFVAARPGGDRFRVRGGKRLRLRVQAMCGAIHGVEHGALKIVLDHHLAARGVLHFDFEAERAAALGEIAVDQTGG